ncbi:MAG: SEC-C domain-containing protein [Lachnospiraceae bacterium]|nr:SEC-C domain-containing protein [Lachnospiraceae bacterium]
MELKGKLPSRFAPVDPGITTKNIKAKTHLYEMSAQTQEKIYEIMFLPPEDSVSELEKLISDMKVKNEELETLLSGVRNLNSDFSDFLENLSEYTQSDDSSFDSDLLPFRETEEKQEPYRRQAAKIGRNDPCPCRSGKKYKNCCGKNK